MGDNPRTSRITSGRLKKIRSISDENLAATSSEKSHIPPPPCEPAEPKSENKTKPKNNSRKTSKNGNCGQDERVIMTYAVKGKTPSKSEVTETPLKTKLNLKHTGGDNIPLKLEGPPTPSVKALYHRQVMEGERARAAAYRKAVGRRNAFDGGMKGKRGGRGAMLKNGDKNTRSRSVMEESNAKDFHQEHNHNRAKSSIAEFSDDEIDRIYHNQKERNSSTAITKGQIIAFKEVFDLFDRNGGGTIDAQELTETLQSVDIMLTQEETQEVLQLIDKDGNGEIDFEEFLQMMTNTERFIEAITKSRKNEEEESGRQDTLLFDALTEFMKKSALHSMDEIVDYYSHKYKKAQTPHVVNHYAAGARLIGLTERQLKEHLEHLKASRVVTGTNNKFLKNSPYAMPLHIISSSTNFPSISRIQKPGRGRIKLFVNIKENGSTAGHSTNGPGNKIHRFLNRDQVKLHHVPVVKRGFGWVSQHTEHIEVHLHTNPLKKLVPFHALTAEDLPAIRDNVEAATHSYTKERRHAQLMDSYKHWHALDASLISPQILQEHFRGSFSIYSLVAKRHLQIM